MATALVEESVMTGEERAFEAGRLAFWAVSGLLVGFALWLLLG